MDEEGCPLDELVDNVIDWCKSLDINMQNITTLTHLRTQTIPAFTEAIQAGIDRVNQQAVSRAQKIQKFYILPRDFSIPGGELGKRPS